MADITGTAGDDTLPGPGDPPTSGNDTISGLAGNDTLHGGDGDDLLLGGDDNDLLDGGEGNDTLYGHAGTNTLQGWAGNDLIYAAGDDSVSGGAGNDTLTVLSVLGTTYDGGGDTDSLALDFSAAGAGATVNLTNLFAGLNGSIGTATVSSFETIAGTITGSGFADSITIGHFYASAVTMNLGDGNDFATGGSGNDILTGGLGNDTLAGGNGNDTLNDADGITALSGDAGDDTVMLGAVTGGYAEGGFNYDYLRFDMTAAASGVVISLNAAGGVVSGSLGGVSISGFESLNGYFNKTTGHNDTVTLGAGFNTAVIMQLLGGNDSYAGGTGNDYVEGGDGDDTLGGGAGGSDTLFGGIGNDSFVVDNATTALNELAGQGTDTVLASLNWTLANEFENLTLTGFGNTNGYGNGVANVVTGNNGDNRLEGNDGNDTLNGGNGGDALFGGLGNDTLNGGSGNDHLDDGQGSNTLNGGVGDDYIVFDGDAVNTADGGAGGYDVLEVRQNGRTTGFAIDLTGMWSGGVGSVNGGTVTGFEGVVGLTGTQWADVVNLGAGTSGGASIIDAGAGDDILTGTDGNNYLNGGEGNDTIVSGAGSDTLLGGAGNDTITIGIGTAGTVDGGTGTDTLAFVQFAFGPAIALNIDFTLLWSGGTGTFNGIAVTGIELLQVPFIEGTAPFYTSGDDTIVIGAGYTGNVHMETGTGDDSVSGGSGNDIIDGAQDDDVIHGGAGNDSLGGSYGSDTVYGEAGDDVIGGDTLDGEWAWGNDHLYGGDGNDTIEAGAYQDWLYGEAGNDVLLGDSLPLDAGDHGNDLLDGGTGDDQLSGMGGDDALFGGDGADLLEGGTGVDTLSGGTGADTMVGGTGDDRYVVDNAGDTVTELTGQGTDTVESSISFSLVGQFIEALTLTGSGAINATGNGLANTLTGNAGANLLTGLDGNDTLNGGTGADAMVGGRGDDRYVVDNAGDTATELGGQGTDTVESSVSFSLTGQYLEHLTLTGSGAINATGNSLANTLTGNAGANLLTGLDGNDTLIGGTGADTMVGGTGNDRYVVDNAGDTVTELNGQGTDTVESSVSFDLAGQYLENLTLTGSGTINATGNGLANTLVGNAGNNVLDGGGSADTMRGGAGNDRYIVDNAGDTVTEFNGQGTDTVESSVSFSLVGQFIEALTLTGSGAIDATGNGLANTLVGNAGNNVLDGGTSADTMRGGAGNDRYIVDNAGDTVTELNGQGTDTVESSVSFSLVGQFIEALTLTGSGTINATGNGLANTLVGNAGNNVLDGGTSADTLTGGAGSDSFQFSSALGGGNIDAIADYSVPDDRILLDDAIFTGLAAGALSAGAFHTGAAAADAGDRIIYNSATGALLFDVDGVGGAAAVQFATLSAGLPLTNAEFLVI